jgi:integrase
MPGGITNQGRARETRPDRRTRARDRGPAHGVPQASHAQGRGLGYLTASPVDCRFHDLRHAFASYMMMRGCDVKTLQTLLGHRDITMTLRYAHFSPSHLRDSVQRLDTLWTPEPTRREQSLS